MPRPRPKLTTGQQLAKAARAGQPVELAELPAKIICPRCQQEQWPDEDGTPRYHQRAARPGEETYSAEWPTMTSCVE